MGGGKRENNTGTHRARMSRARTGCPLRVMVATVVSTTAGKGEELASLGSGFIRRSDQEKRGGEEGPRAAVRGAAGHSWGNGAQAGSRAGLSGARHSLSCMDVAYVAPTCPIHVVQDLGLGSPVCGVTWCQWEPSWERAGRGINADLLCYPKKLSLRGFAVGTHLRYLSSHPAQP